MKRYKLKALLVVFLLLQSIITQAQNTELWGMSSWGGGYNSGTIFKTDSEGNNFSVVHAFYRTVGEHPNKKLCEASNGKLYGMTQGRGAYSSGVLFEYDPATDTYIKKFDFDGSATGAGPSGSLIEASNGKLYGMTSNGGENDYGVLFEYDPATDIYTKKLDFDGSASGGHPLGSLIEAGNGKLYGMTYRGGVNNYGVLFEYDLSTDIYTKKLDFDGSTTGSYPRGSLIEAGNGKFYGMTNLGGANNNGVLFEYDPTTDTYTKKLDFDGSTTGSSPLGSLLEAGNGKMYGMTAHGGANYYGVLFEYDPITNNFTKKLDFDGSTLGGNPYGTLIEASNGKLYGMTYQGGVNNYGVLFEYNPITLSLIHI